jgi:hypothetical protein
MLQSEVALLVTVFLLRLLVSIIVIIIIIIIIIIITIAVIVVIVAGVGNPWSRCGARILGNFRVPSFVRKRLRGMCTAKS